MKILSFLFCALLLSNQALAASNNVKSAAEKKFVDEIGGKKLVDKEIKPFDFEKVFVEAEAYFKAAQSWKKLRCEGKSGFICIKKECIKKPIVSHIILDKKKGLVSRCEGDHCEDFEAEFTQTGVFFNVQTKGPIGSIIRILGDSRYKEVSLFGLDAYIVNGNCEVITD
jgi:hypothetical protein